MRLPIALALALATISPSLAQVPIAPEIERMMSCGYVYSLRSKDAETAGDPDTAAEFFNRADNLLWLAREQLLQAGHDVSVVDDILSNSAVTTGLEYGFGNGETMLAQCLAEEDSP